MDGEKPPVMDGEKPPVMDGEKPPVMDGEKPPVMDGEKPPVMDGEKPPVMDGEKPPVMDGEKPPVMDGEKPPVMDGEELPIMDGEQPPVTNGEKPSKPPKPNKLLQDVGVDPEQIQHFDKDKVKELKPEQIQHFNKDNVRDLPVDAVSEFTKDQFKTVSKEAAKGFKPEQIKNIPANAFKGLSRENLGGLEPEAIQAITSDQLEQIDPNEVQALPDREQARLLANLDPNVDETKVEGFLPPGWTIGKGKGLGRPVGAPVELPPLLPKEVLKLKLPKISNLRQGFGLGGSIGEGETDAITGINEMLSDTGFTVEQQEEGVLRVTDEGDAELAFLPDSENMEQGDPDAAPGITMDEEGKFVLVLKGGYKIPVRPACKDPVGLAEILPDTGEVEIDENAQVRMQLDDNNVVSGVFDFNVFDAPADLAPGVHMMGEGKDREMMVVYKNGKAQKAKPAVKSPKKFKELALQFFGVQSVVINMDGTIQVIYEGMPLHLRPALEVTPPQADATDTAFEPSIDITEEGTLRFVDEQGDTQELSVELDAADGS